MNFNKYEENEAEFFNDLLEKFSLPNNEITRKMYSMAWEEGHSYGYSEIFCYFQNYVELYEIIVKNKAVL